jgi:hypothetical protein
MHAYDELLDHIQALKIVDTHEHLPLEKDLPPGADVLNQWLMHYFSCDLVSAGMSDAEMNKVRDPRGDLRERWAIAAPYWHAAKSTGYGRSLAYAARDLFGIEEINGDTIVTLNERMMAGRKGGGYYRHVLQEKSGIRVSIRDSRPPNDADLATDDPFVYTLRIDHLVAPGHYNTLRDLGAGLGVKVHSLGDYEEALRRLIERDLVGQERVVCLKCGLAYQRSLRFDKVTRADAERDFNELFADPNLPAWRPGIKPGKALQNHLQHFICKVADEHGLTYQFHTGLQEGNGNVISDSNPTLLTNLFLEYGNVKFDLFHLGYPYVMEIGNLAKNFRNVFIDMCWGHIISPEASRRALVEWLDTVPANKISAFGGDYCFVEGVYGHQYLARRNVAWSLAQKVADDTMDLEWAKEVAGWLFVENPTRLFGLAQAWKR